MIEKFRMRSMGRRSIASAAFAALTALLAAATAAALPAPAPCHGCWDPKPTTKPWQWQLQGRIDLSIKAPVYDIDMDVNQGNVKRIHQHGAKAICYVDVGSWEPYRDDAGKFPKRILGRHFPGFPQERWLDVRALNVLKPIMRMRFQRCASKGFDAVEPDNEDGYQNKTGFDISAKDQLRYDTWVSNAIHKLGMAAGLKNDLGQVKAMLPYVDFEINEQCFQYNEWSKLESFITHGKPVYGAEYELPLSKFCAKSKQLGFSTIKKRYSLKAYRRTC
jgi:endo-alpha-1,4-polygalactosaminidase (GH114 family)